MPNFKNNDPSVTVFTGGQDRSYAIGLAAGLVAAGLSFDFIGSDEVNGPELHGNPQVNFLNLRGDQSSRVGKWQKVLRVLAYYWRIIGYAATARPKIFHILWNNKFEFFDRTVLMAYYKLLGRRIVFTAHNVNAARRDRHDSWLNRLTLKIQYRLCDHIFVHTAKMREELCSDFDVHPDKATVIPLGINRTIPNTNLTGAEARQQLGLIPEDRVVLFFGQIAPYKGLEFLVAAFEQIEQQNPGHRLVIVGRPKGPPAYWEGIRTSIAVSKYGARILQKIEFVPDADTELYFKAADVLILPYVEIFQSGLLSLAYSFGLPVIAADVGSFKEEIVEGKTGFVFEAKSVPALAGTLNQYFKSGLYRDLNSQRQAIQDHADEKYSWAKVIAITADVYAKYSHEPEKFRPACVANKL